MGSRSQSAELDLCQVDARLRLVRRIVADPEEAFVVDDAGVAGVASRRQGNELAQGAFLAVDPAKAGAYSVSIKAHGGDEAGIGKLDHLGAANLYPKVLPGPLRVRRLGRAKLP